MLGVLLSGGFGSRMAPFTTTITNKHLAPVYSRFGAKPMIDYPINTLKKMGITEILVITSKDHCGDIVEHLGDGYQLGIDITYKVQDMNDPERPIGIASALKLARKFTRDEKFVVILGDNYYQWCDKIKSSIDWFDSNESKCGLFLKKTDDWGRFGIAVVEDSKVKKIIEKPKEFVSNLAVTGMYMYTSDVYNYLDELTPSQRGELEISDINSRYAECDSVRVTELTTYWSDMGTPDSILDVQNFLNE